MISIRPSVEGDAEALCSLDLIAREENERREFILRMQSLLAKLEYELSGVIHNLDEGDPEIVYFKRLR